VGDSGRDGTDRRAFSPIVGQSSSTKLDRDLGVGPSHAINAACEATVSSQFARSICTPTSESVTLATETDNPPTSVAG
jgi:hypothetical protein